MRMNLLINLAVVCLQKISTDRLGALLVRACIMQLLLESVFDIGKQGIIDTLLSLGTDQARHAMLFVLDN